MVPSMPKAIHQCQKQDLLRIGATAYQIVFVVKMLA
jgi:hypothetical protein